MFIRVLSLTTTLLWTADLAFAEQVYKCVDGNGTVTFTQQACPGSGLTGGKVDIHAAPPGNVVINPRPTQAAPAPVTPPATQQYAPPANNGVVVVGGSEERERCSTGLSERDLRTAMVREEIVPGMSRKQIESMFGTPNDQVNSVGAGATTYWNDRYLKFFTVEYDANGCVTSSYVSGKNSR